MNIRRTYTIIFETKNQELADDFAADLKQLINEEWATYYECTVKLNEK